VRLRWSLANSSWWSLSPLGSVLEAPRGVSYDVGTGLAAGVARCGLRGGGKPPTRTQPLPVAVLVPEAHPCPLLALAASAVAFPSTLAQVEDGTEPADPDHDMGVNGHTGSRKRKRVEKVVASGGALDAGDAPSNSQRCVVGCCANQRPCRRVFVCLV
jgi:hypothetical protein